MMEEYIYKERKVLRIYIWAFSVAGAIVILMMLGQISHDLISSYEQTDKNDILGVGVIGFIWIVMAWYCVVNSPTKLVLTDWAMQVTWNGRKRKDYSWQDVTVKKTGGPEFDLILIHDSDWLLSRWVILDGSSKQYKELISKIRQIKQLTKIDWL